MSRGAICTYSFRPIVLAGTQSIVVSMAALVGIPVPPTAGWLTRIRVKSEDAALTGGNYDVTLWATDSGAALNRAMFEVFRQTGIAVAGGSASERVDLNQPLDVSYRMQTDAPAHIPDMQIEIDTGANEAADREFRVTLEIQGDQTPASPTVPNTTLFENTPF